MYSQEAIDSLVNLIGFGPQGNLEVNIDEENQVGSSLRTFASFHRSITLNNIYETVEEHYLDQDEFNQFLKQAKIDAAVHSLSSVIDSHPEHQSDFDYSDVIQSNLSVFQCCVGLSLAASMLEMMITSTRMNISEREASLSYSQLKIELDGAKNENGHVLAFGLRSKFNVCAGKACAIFYPEDPIVQKGENW